MLLCEAIEALDQSTSDAKPGRNGQLDIELTEDMAMFTKFLKDDEGAQVVEYALIIAVISIVLVLALQPVLIAGNFGGFIGRLATCLTTALACA